MRIVKKGNIVFLMAPDTSWGKCSLGKIKVTYTGKDGKVWAVNIYINGK